MRGDLLMKKQSWIVILVIVLAVLCIPIPFSAHRDGGTREYKALAYKIVDWNRLVENGIYEKTRVYLFPENLKHIDELWAYEAYNAESKFSGKILEITGTSVLVQPLKNAGDQRDDRITFDVSQLEDIGAEVGSFVEVTYTGYIMETYPGQVNAIKWEQARDLRPLTYNEQWLDKNIAEKRDNNIFSDIIITKIFDNCFFAETVIPMPYEIKLNGKLTDEWCVGDQVYVTYENTYYDAQNRRAEADLLSVEISNFIPDPNVCYKPVIYLYPEEEIQTSVELLLDGRLTCTYPAYNSGWQVTAAPDGTLTDAEGQTYNYLYWEGQTNAQWDMSKGFCIKGEDTAEFLENALAQLGLNRKEANEFIVYWLPLMQDNAYNVIAFQGDAYTDAAQLRVTPAPDTVIRVFMTWRASENYVEIAPQTLTAPSRTGFTVVEWGGTEMK